MDNNHETTAAKSEGLEQDELIIQQHREIEKEISDSILLIGEKEELTSLETEYINDPVYLTKIQDLNKKYKCMRRARPDGNCFFRSFAFAYFEYLIDHNEEYKHFKERALKSKDELISCGFTQFTLEDFHDTFMEVVNLIGEGQHEKLYDTFNMQGYSDYVVVYLRLITSGQLQKDAEFYKHFIEGDRTVVEFCHQEVEPMFKESDHIHIIALSTALNVGVRVRYMDRGESSEAIAHDFPEGSPVCVHLLYRPGHYDILYSR
uniref:ubiquitinyl hydrolase 1 n=2 Tax=Melanaphis sacchari TaxID=742174 RepID=A0A2H8TDF9_9HEMI